MFGSQGAGAVLFDAAAAWTAALASHAFRSPISPLLIARLFPFRDARRDPCRDARRDARREARAGWVGGGGGELDMQMRTRRGVSRPRGGAWAPRKRGLPI